MTFRPVAPLAIVPRTEGSVRLALWEELDRALAQRTDTAARAERRLRHRLARLVPAASVPVQPPGRP